MKKSFFTLSVLSVMVAFIASTGPSKASILPYNRLLTPGVADIAVTQKTIATTICVPGYTKTVRNVSQATKQKVYASYSYTPIPGGQEVDHLIPLELGGSNDIRNLWPEPFIGPRPNARDKDAAENRLHDDVCSGRMTLRAAQKAILNPVNWHK